MNSILITSFRLYFNWQNSYLTWPFSFQPCKNSSIEMQFWCLKIPAPTLPFCWESLLCYIQRQENNWIIFISTLCLSIGVWFTISLFEMLLYPSPLEVVGCETRCWQYCWCFSLLCDDEPFLGHKHHFLLFCVFNFCARRSFASLILLCGFSCGDLSR